MNIQMLFSFIVIFGDLILTGKFYCLNFFYWKNGIDKNFFYQCHLLYNLIYFLKNVPGDYQLILREYFNRDELKENFDRVGQK